MIMKIFFFKLFSNILRFMLDDFLSKRMKRSWFKKKVKPILNKPNVKAVANRVVFEAAREAVKHWGPSIIAAAGTWFG